MKQRLLLLAALAMTAAAFSAPLSIRPARADVPADQVGIPVAGSALSGLTTVPYSLAPAFSPSIHDYVVRCQPGVNPITLNLTAAPGGSVQVGYQNGPTATVSVSLAESQAAVVQATDPANPRGPQVQYWIRCLPHDFPQLTVSKPGAPAPGWYLTGNISPAKDGSSNTYAMILDENGTPVWYQPAPGGAVNVELLPNNTIAWAPSLGPGVGSNPKGAYSLYQLDTQTTSAVAAPQPGPEIQPTDPHELLQLSNGHRMMIATPLKLNQDLAALAQFNTPNFTYTGNSTIVDCVIDELNPDGSLAWQWRASEHVNPVESNRPVAVNYNGQYVADIYHCNSVDVDPSSADVLVSMRHTDAVYRITKATKMIAWKMGGNAYQKDPAPHLKVSPNQIRRMVSLGSTTPVFGRVATFRIPTSPSTTTTRPPHLLARSPPPIPSTAQRRAPREVWSTRSTPPLERQLWSGSTPRPTA